MRISIALALAAGVIAASAAAAPALGPETHICGQVKHGPRVTWTFQLTGATLTGTTWTVFADPGIDCKFALRVTPGLLKQWGKAKPASNLSPGLAGWVCQRSPSTPGSRGIGSCIKSTSGFEFWMTGKLTLAQLRGFKLLGH